MEEEALWDAWKHWMLVQQPRHGSVPIWDLVHQTWRLLGHGLIGSKFPFILLVPVQCIFVDHFSQSQGHGKHVKWGWSFKSKGQCHFSSRETRGVSHTHTPHGLAIYIIKNYWKTKEELWKFKYFIMQKL
jgi:hypothetical protein